MGAGENQICLFTIGRDTPVRSLVMPIINISGNPKISQKMYCNIDIDEGTIMEGRETLDETAERNIKGIVEVINGKTTAAGKRYSALK